MLPLRVDISLLAFHSYHNTPEIFTFSFVSPQKHFLLSIFRPRFLGSPTVTNTEILKTRQISIFLSISFRIFSFLNAYRIIILQFPFISTGSVLKFGPLLYFLGPSGFYPPTFSVLCLAFRLECGNRVSRGKRALIRALGSGGKIRKRVRPSRSLQISVILPFPSSPLPL